MAGSVRPLWTTEFRVKPIVNVARNAQRHHIVGGVRLDPSSTQSVLQ